MFGVFTGKKNVINFFLSITRQFRGPDLNNRRPMWGHDPRLKKRCLTFRTVQQGIPGTFNVIDNRHSHSHLLPGSS